MSDLPELETVRINALVYFSDGKIRVIANVTDVRRDDTDIVFEFEKIGAAGKIECHTERFGWGDAIKVELLPQ